MANSQTKNSFEYSENKKQRRIERKYNRLVSQAIEEYKDKPMKDLLDYFDELKSQMESEFAKAGILSEDK